MRLRKKTLSLQRAYFNEGFNGSLEEILKGSFDKLATAKERIVEVDMVSSQVFASLELAGSHDGIFVRVFEFESGATGVIDLDTTDQTAVIEEFTHPKNKNFLKDEIVFLIVDNHIVACNMKNKHGTLSAKILDLAQKANILSQDIRMQISDVPDETTLERISEVGVREVSFSITSFLEGLNLNTKDQAGTRLMSMLFGMPETGERSLVRANATGRVILKRGKFLASEVKRDVWLTEIGRELLVAGSSEQYTIHLEDETKISNAMLRKSKSVSLRRHANSFSFEHAKMELGAYYKSLLKEGAIGV